MLLPLVRAKQPKKDIKLQNKKDKWGKHIRKPIAKEPKH